MYSYSYKPGPSKIIDGLYLGNSEDAKDLKVLQELGIKCILVAGNNLEIHYPNVMIIDYIYYLIIVICL